MLGVVVDLMMVVCLLWGRLMCDRLVVCILLLIHLGKVCRWMHGLELG